MPNTPPTHRFLALAFSLCAATCTAALAVPPAAIGPKPADKSSKDFDFLYGSWIVHNRRLTRRLANPFGAGISADDGKSWETNRTMEFVRRQPLSDRATASRIHHEND